MKWIEPLELDLATVDKIIQVSFLLPFCLTESETTDSVPSDEENAEVSAFWNLNVLGQDLKIMSRGILSSSMFATAYH